MYEEDRRHINTDSDSEILLNVFAARAADPGARTRSAPDHIFKAVAGVHARARGGYADRVRWCSATASCAFRDPFGIRPLVLGERDTAEGTRIHGRVGVGRARYSRFQASCAMSRPAKPCC